MCAQDAIPFDGRTGFCDVSLSARVTRGRELSTTDARPGYRESIMDFCGGFCIGYFVNPVTAWYYMGQRNFVIRC